MNDKNDYVVKIFIIFSIVFGVTFSFLIPFYQTPDEYSHYAMIYDEVGIIDDFSKQVRDYNDSSRIIINYNQKVNKSVNLNLKYKFKVNKIKFKPSLKIVKHFPQNIILFLSSIVGLPIFIGTSLAELSSLAFYIVVCCIALKKMPIKRELMMFVMLLPMCVQQISSVSYDVMLISCCHLFVAEILYLKFVKKWFTLKDVLKIIILLSIITIVKIPYSALCLLIFLIPSEKFNIKIGKLMIDKEFIRNNKKRIVLFAVSIITLLLLIFYKIRNYLLKISLFRVFLAFILSPFSSFKLICRTIESQRQFYLDSFLGNFGWLDTPISPMLRMLILFMLIIMVFVKFDNIKIDAEKEKKFKVWEIILLWSIFILILILIMIPMFSWSFSMFAIPNYESLSISEYTNYIKSFNYIAGVQGRYFLPFIILIFLPLNCKKITKFFKRFNFKIILILYFIITYVWLVIVFLNRYWIYS